MSSFPVPLQTQRVFHFKPAPPDDPPKSVRFRMQKQINNANPRNQNKEENVDNTNDNIPLGTKANANAAHSTNNLLSKKNNTNNKINEFGFSKTKSKDNFRFKPLPPRTPPKSARAANPRFRKKPMNRIFNGNIKPPDLSEPITPTEAIQKFSSALTSFELTEIKEFDEIYFLGNPSKKIKNVTTNARNKGFDDQHHHYKISIGDHIAYRYEIKALFGKGAFGQVIRVYDHKLKTEVALKIIINTRQMHEQGLIEVNLLKMLNDNSDPLHNNYIVKVTDSFIFRSHICVTFEILGLNLYDYSRSIKYKALPMNQLKMISQQMFTALKFIHESKKIVHCDMKPENVLLVKNNKNCIRVIDFGSSCEIGKQKYTYIQSRFYRAPEVILGIKYGPPMDIWSVGCIIVEMELGKPLFPGDDENQQIKYFLEVLGLPPRNVIMQGTRRRTFFNDDCTPLNDSGKSIRIGSRPLKTASKIDDPLLLDLLSKCFEWDQTKRITADQALKHPWFNTRTIQSSRSNHNLLPELKK